MRAMFEQFGIALFVDVMKRQQNKINWPYYSMVVIDNDMKIGLAAEGIACAERTDGYAWFIQSIGEMAPGRHLSTLKVIFADCFATDAMLEQIGLLSTCTLVWDVHHLLDEVWPQLFGNAHHAVKDHLSSMVYSHSAAKFDEALR